MCELLGLNCSELTDVTFSFTGFSARGGGTAHHADGWGIGFFEDRACQIFIDHRPSCESPVAELIKRYPIKSKNTIAHIRKATQGITALENCHPFRRELWGRHWLFAHNGDLQNYSQNALSTGNFYQPVGSTDSEYAFCALMEGIRNAFPTQQPTQEALFEKVTELTQKITDYGIFNFLLSNGQFLISYCSTRLHYVARRWPFSTAHLIDADMSMDFAQHTTPEDRIAVIATQPLTDNEIWQAFAPGDLCLFQGGELKLKAFVPVLPEVIERGKKMEQEARARASLAAKERAALARPPEAKSA